MSDRTVGPRVTNDLIGDVGFDVKYGLNRNLTADLPVGQFATQLYRTRVSYSFSPRVFVLDPGKRALRRLGR